MVDAVDAIITSSPFAARQIEACYGRPAAVITLGIDRDRLDGGRHDPVAGPPRLLTVNYLHPRKRIDLIVRAVAELASRTASSEVPAAGSSRAPLLTIVGDGPEREALENLATGLGIADNVEFVGFVADEELPRYYWDATCYVHSARDESFGLSVIEAAYCARPIVAVDEGGVRETVEEGVTGYRVGASPVAIADGIIRILATPDGGAQLGEAGRAKITTEFRWSRGADDILGVASRVEGGWSGRD
jgi:glycosyltransferase involved in cell wall biosynthesis